jgi:DsbC/DsbD-like thiol-disulfide interchange protein
VRGLLPFLAATIFLLASCGLCLADSVQARHARVELVSAQSSAAPGQQLWLGIHFSLEKDWHIYWTNPGDSGQPPVLQWQLPSGSTAGTVEWPVPEKLKRSSLADYGYQDDVVLLVPVHLAAALKAGGKAELALQAKWLICSDVCIPDRAQLHLSLPVASTPTQAPGEARLLDEAKRHLPKPWPRSWKSWAASGKDDFVLSIVAGKPIPAAEFFPLMPEQIENAAPQPLQADPKGATITLKKSDQLLKPVTVLKGLLVLPGGESYAIAAPVTPASAQRHNNGHNNER